MVSRDKIIKNLDSYLKVSEIRDYGPNGLQVEGTKNISKIVVGVSASVELFETAVGAKAQMVIVHHGIFWKNSSVVVTGAHKKRLKILLENDINLLAYHLPLDCNDEIGNNILAAKALKIEDTKQFGEVNGVKIGVVGTREPIDSQLFFKEVEKFYGRKPLIFPYGPKKIEKVGIISGGGQSNLGEAIEKGFDCFITGEVSEHNFYMAQEGEIHFISAGHYATERPGIFALGDYLNSTFEVEVIKVDIPNPV